MKLTLETKPTLVRRTLHHLVHLPLKTSVDCLIYWRIFCLLCRKTLRGKTTLLVQPDWVENIEELGGGGLLDEDNPLWDTIASLALKAINSKT